MARKKRRREKEEERGIAASRAVTLTRLADEAALGGRLDRAERYVGLARKVSRRHQLGTGAALRDRCCRECGAYLLPGRTARVRLRGGHRALTCLRCGSTRRFVYAA